MRPSFMTTMRSATDIASSWSCVTRIVVTGTRSCRTAQPLAQLGADLRVQRAEGLVEQQHARLDGERAGEGHALALAAGELVRVAGLVAGEADDAEQLVDLGLDLGLRPLADA